MPRGLTTEQKEILAGRVRSFGYFVSLELSASTLRVWDGSAQVTALGQTWTGTGEFGIISGVESDRSLRAQSISLGLHGIPADSVSAGVMAATRAERYQGRPLVVYLGFLDINTGLPLGDPTPVWTGFADVISFRIGSEISISLTGEHFSSHLRRPNGARMTTESHNQRLGNPDPRDLIFEPQDRLMGRPRPLV